MTSLKTPQEIEWMREAGKVLGNVLKELGEMIREGMTPRQLDEHAEQRIREHGMSPGFKGYRGYPATCCINVNEVVVHAIPDDRPFQRGDLVTIDCGVVHHGLNTDAAISVIVGGPDATDERTRQLNHATRKAMNKAIELIKPGVRIGDLSHAIQQTVEQAGFTIIPELTGHGIGTHLHEPPNIANCGKKGTGPVLKPGMTLCIEPIVSAGTRFIDTLKDQWTIAIRDNSRGCQWEHTILVTETGHEVLTEAEVNE